MLKIIHNSNPEVSTISNFITPAECQHMIDISKSMMKDSLVSINNKGVTSNGRTSMNTWIRHDYDKITKEIGERISDIVGIPLENAEAFQVIYYDKNGEYRQHYDSWVHDGSEKTLRCMKWGGARVKTALCYLNDVTKGGGTKMTRLGITIPPEKGKLLIFDNTISREDHTRHEMSEHAGMPVEEGEKYAFNLWFKECNSKMLYKDFNPGYYEPVVLPTNGTLIRKSCVDDTTINRLLVECNFNANRRRDGWVNLDSFPDLIRKIEDVTGITRDFYENINVVEYKPDILHERHLTAYDMNSVTGKKYTAKLGQRTHTITMVLSDNVSIKFPRITTDDNYVYRKGDVLFYKNVLGDTSDRDSEMARTIVCTQGMGYIANVYVRAKCRNTGQLVSSNVSTNVSSNVSTNVDAGIIDASKEDYGDTLEHVLTSFKQGIIGKNWNGHKSFKYNFKGSFETFSSYMSEYAYIRDTITNKSALNQENLEKTYSLNEDLPIQIVNNVLEPSILTLVQKYYKESIANCVWELGDRQSNRYKAHNEAMSRFLHYEILPLIEKIVGRPMRPTYTYLSAYVNGAELPPHTDRADCEYTVSFIIDKPEGINWNIYVHKVRQPVKFKGRYDIKPPIEECEGVDCDAGGLMLFQGTDHIHFREKLIGQYYNIVLLHYVSV
jgi:prolyl 4-hydroxylase